MSKSSSLQDIHCLGQTIDDICVKAIPRYIDSFESDKALYLVQEYKDADNLTTRYSFQPEEIKAIAERLLEILVYLQSHIPPVIHGDIKPENVLLRTTPSGGLELFLVDFGLSRTSADTPSSDSASTGTYGFIPPEQYRRQLTRASDLYAVGATLICLISGTATQEVHSLTYQDEPHRYKFRERLLTIDSSINPRFIDWLERMVEPDYRNRFPDARTALQAIEPLQVVAKAQVSLSHSQVSLRAKTFGTPIKTQIQVSNLTPNSILGATRQCLLCL